MLYKDKIQRILQEMYRDNIGAHLS